MVVPAQSKAHLATLLREIGEKAKSKALYDEVMEHMTQRQLGASNGTTHKQLSSVRLTVSDHNVQSMHFAAGSEEEGLRESCNQAILLQLMGELSKAREQYEQVIQAQTVAFGGAHPETLLVSA